ncbi:MAG: hypothetical protein JSU81_02415 [Candidatus Coatesbacteria bacterium]|nr:MAG: hypothetical protein JSU81_02415 [Candidatus Coatesbacteria bacterium]
MNTYVPLGAAALVAVMMAVTPRGFPGVEIAYYSGAAAIAIALAAALLFNRLVVTFDGRDIVLAYAIVKKQIPLDKVFSVEAREIKWWRFGGTGIRFAGGGWAWIAGSGPGVKIETTRGFTYANCENPERLAALVEDFRRARGE